MKTVYLYLGTLLIYVLVDLLFINLFAKSFIQKQVGSLLAVKPDWVAGLIFYFIFTAGILYFAVLPASDLKAALWNGAFLGLLCYATYELVNKALLAGWPWAMVAVDLIWGILVGLLTSGMSWYIRNTWLS